MKTQILRWVLVASFSVLVQPDALLFAVITVDTTTDGDDGECILDCTLREAVATAMFGEEIIVPPGAYSLTLGIITFDADRSLSGAGATATHIRSRNRVFAIGNGIAVTISDLTIGPITTGDFGGGIFSEGTLTLSRSWLRDGRAPSGLGGGLQNTGIATINDSTISGGLAEFGAGIFSTSGEVFINNTTISGNTAIFGGGGVLNGSTTMTLNNCTVTGNSATLGGSGGIENHGTLMLSNTIVAAQQIGPDCGGVIDSIAGNNLDSDGTCVMSGVAGNMTAAPLLGQLLDNGGPAPTHAPAAGSPAIDAGSSLTPGGGGDACLTEDQRGVGRPQGGGCDIGAVELGTCTGGDTDGDGICDGVDNCPEGFNPEQDLAVFRQRLRATDSATFSWIGTADIDFVSGDLENFGSYLVSSSGSVPGATSISAMGDDPAPGLGFFYLVKHTGACTVGSWQTFIGIEPGRDLALP